MPAAAMCASEQLLDTVLGVVVKFVTSGAEDLDAVVRHRIMRSRNHDAEIGPVGGGQIRHCRSRQHAHAQHVDALTGKPGNHRRLQQFTAGSRVATDDRHAVGARGAGPVWTVGPREAPGRGRTESQSQLTGQVAVGDAPNAVGSE